MTRKKNVLLYINLFITLAKPQFLIIRRVGLGIMLKNNVMNQSLTLTRRVNKLKDKYYNITLHRGLSLCRILKRQATKWSQLSE